MANAEHKEKWVQHFNSRKMICVGPCWAQLCHVFKSTPPQRVPLVGHRDRLGHWGALAVALPAGGCWDPQERQSIHEGSRKGKMLGKLGGERKVWGDHTQSGEVDSAQSSSQSLVLVVPARGRAMIPTPEMGLIFYLLGKNLFPFPASLKKKRASKRKKNPLRLIKGKCSHLGKTEGFSLMAYEKQQPAGFSSSLSPFPAPPCHPSHSTSQQLQQWHPGHLGCSRGFGTHGGVAEDGAGASQHPLAWICSEWWGMEDPSPSSPKASAFGRARRWLCRRVTSHGREGKGHVGPKDSAGCPPVSKHGPHGEPGPG